MRITIEFDGATVSYGDLLSMPSERPADFDQLVLVGRVGALCGNVRIVEGRFFASEHAIVVTPFSDTSVQFLGRILDRMALNRFSEASAQPVLTVAKLLKLEARFPPSRVEQSAIATVLSDMDTEIAAIESKLTKARLIKQGMMQELLTGRIRLVEQESAVTHP